MKFEQLHYFLSQNVGGTKDITSPLSQICGGHVSPVPHKLGPWSKHTRKISKLSLLLVTARLLHHNRCLFLETWY